jgi:hypothetical protein
MWRNQNFHMLLMEMSLRKQSLCKTAWQSLKRLNMYLSVNKQFHSKVYTKRNENLHTDVHNSVIHNSPK